jgi:hypothetical protein
MRFSFPSQARATAMLLLMIVGIKVQAFVNPLMAKFLY